MLLTRKKFSDLQTVFRLSSWMCVFPFDDSWEFSHLLACLSAPVAILLLAYNMVEASGKLRGSAPNFADISYILRRALVALMPAAHLYQAYSQRRRILSCFQVVEGCESTLSGLGLCPEYRPAMLFSAFACRAVFTVGHHLLSTYLRATDILDPWTNLLHITACLLLAELMEVQLFTLFLVVRSLLASLTAAVSRLPTDRKRLETLVRTHHLLAGVADDLDNTYSIQILLSLSYVYIALLCFSLETIQGFLKLLKGKESWENIFRTSTWVLYCFSHFQFVAYNCVSLSKEIKKTNKSLYKVMLESHSRDIMRSGKLKLQLEMDREVTLSASGMFPLDYTMLHSVAASSAVFLVIISQIGT